MFRELFWLPLSKNQARKIILLMEAEFYTIMIEMNAKQD
jgi:hypothetical protein